VIGWVRALGAEARSKEFKAGREREREQIGKENKRRMKGRKE
jgi:hypothetical protein